MSINNNTYTLEEITIRVDDAILKITKGVDKQIIIQSRAILTPQQNNDKEIQINL